ncbi:MAG: ribosome-associated translation inhibitor RaiA [Anaerolineae bacterium]|jgi:putative sigma-54 modulation protein|nr:ribosome-associated translation inhibitor RaiA [Anaerolineae bacterium]
MDVTIHGNNITVADHIEAYAQERLSRLTRFLPNISSVRADIARQHNSRGRDIVAVQITVRHSRGAILRAEEKMDMSGDTNAVKVAINGAIDKMYSRIQRFKGKRDVKRVRERFMATPEEIDLSEEVPETTTQEMAVPDAGWKEAQILRRKEISVMAMNEDEAVEQMELLGHDFFLFFNADQNQMQVVYRRSSGGYGVLLPKLE